jgi:hypothetical protein
MMTMEQELSRSPATDADGHSVVASWRASIAMWVTALGEAYVASAMYQDLSRLSDAELHRRGLNRESLAREVFNATTRTAE